MIRESSAMIETRDAVKACGGSLIQRRVVSHEIQGKKVIAMVKGKCLPSKRTRVMREREGGDRTGATPEVCQSGSSGW
jgi:hypothetical protein